MKEIFNFLFVIHVSIKYLREGRLVLGKYRLDFHDTVCLTLYFDLKKKLKQKECYFLSL